MSLTRLPSETQRAFVERVLREDGRIAVYDVLWNTTYPDGKKAAVTRLASVIHTLRHKAGWDIETEDEGGQVAVYHLRAMPHGPYPRPVPMPEQPEWTRLWTCTECGGRPASQPFGLLGDMGRAHCGSCAQTRYFRRKTAA